MTDETRATTAEMLKRLDHGWNDFQAYLKTLTEQQMTVPTDDVGWTVKDHLSHLAVWEDGIAALLKRQSRREAMGLDEATWKSGGYDLMNNVIRSHHSEKSLVETMTFFQEAHQRLVDSVKQLSDEDLNSPYRAFDPQSTSTNPVFASIVGNAYGHYEEHKPWIEAIVAKSRDSS